MRILTILIITLSLVLSSCSLSNKSTNISRIHPQKLIVQQQLAVKQQIGKTIENKGLNPDNITNIDPVSCNSSTETKKQHHYESFPKFVERNVKKLPIEKMATNFGKINVSQYVKSIARQQKNIVSIQDQKTGSNPKILTLAIICLALGVLMLLSIAFIKSLSYSFPILVLIALLILAGILALFVWLYYNSIGTK
jgi:hypothetical protein